MHDFRQRLAAKMAILDFLDFEKTKALQVRHLKTTHYRGYLGKI